MIERMSHHVGKVYLVGAGPGDPDLITIKGQKALQQADVVVYDRLINPELLSYTGTDSEHIYVGKTPGQPSASQEQINRILVGQARKGKSVVRLKGGDPFVFGRGGEEVQALVEGQIEYQVIPGITSAFAAPGHLGIPVTHRGAARSVTVLTGHTKDNGLGGYDWRQLAGLDTLVIMMGMRNLAEICGKLMDHGKASSTPIAIIERATRADQKQTVGTLEDITGKAEGLKAPATIVVGEVVALNRNAGLQHEEEMPQQPDLSPVLAL